MSFWEKNIKNQLPVEQHQEVILDEEAMQTLEEEPESDIFEEEEDDIQNLMSDANLRLEQGRLYQMVLQGDIFADTNADPRAIKNVQREIRKFVKNRMEVMLGISQEQAQQTIVSSPFNDMEVAVLKMLASRMSKGESEKVGAAAPQIAPTAPKKDGITSISGTVKHTPAPVKEQPRQLPKAQPQQQQVKKSSGKSAISTGDPKITKPIEKMTIEELDSFQKSKLKKPISEMTPEELAEHDKQTLENRARNYAKKPDNMVPHPSPQQLEMMYTAQVAQTAAPGSAVSTIMGMMNSRKP